jgi:short subunit dehydrogenase-like uncharacterized protein
MIDQFDVAARKSGSRIVHFCGHDCIPWDLSVLELSKALKKKGETLSKVSGISLDSPRSSTHLRLFRLTSMMTFKHQHQGEL